MRCPKCGYPNREGAVVCDHCRTRLSLPCPRCGFGVDEGASACPRCGQAIAGGQAAPSAAEKQLFILGGRYQVLQQVSRGRTSAVYRAHDRSTGRTVAVKRLDTIALVTPEEKRSALAQFEREVTLLEGLKHRGVVPVLDHFREKQSVFVVMPWVTGSTLAEVRLEGPLPEPQVRAIGLQLAAAIGYLHSQSPPILLRDLKPSHVMIDTAGRAILLDLGLSRLFRAGQSRGTANRGTAPYEAPEQADDGYAGPQSDVHALSTLLLVLARGPAGTGKALSPTFRRAIARARRKDPDRRTPTMERFARSLATGGEAVATPALVLEAAPESAPDDTEVAPPTPAPVPPRPRPDRAALPQVTIITKRLRVVRRPGRTRAGYRLRLRNNLPEPVDVRVRSGVPWLTVPANTITVPPSSEHAITVAADLRQAPAPGTRASRAVLLIDGGRRWVPAEVVEPPPALVVDKQSLDFGTVGPQGGVACLAVRNDGGGSIPVRVTARHPWLSLSRAELSLAPGQEAEVEVRLRGDEAPEPGRYEGAVVVDTDLDQVPVDVSFAVGRPELRLHQTALALGTIRHPDEAQTEIVLSNRGSAPAQVRFSSTHEALTLSHGDVTLPSQHRVRVTAKLETKGLPAGKLSLSPAVRVSSAAGSYALPLEAEVVRPLLAVSERDFDLGRLTPAEVDAAEASLVVSNQGNADLEFEIEPHVPWLQAEPASARLVGGASTVVRLSLSATDAQTPGIQEGQPTATVRSQGGVIPLSLRFALIRPVLAVEPAAIDFGIVPAQGVGERHLVLANRGTGPLRWAARTDAAWLEIAPSAGECAEGASSPIVVRAYGLAIPTGTDQAKGTLVFEGPHNRQAVPATVALSQPILMVAPVAELPESVDLAPTQGQVMLFNRGAGDLEATVTSKHPSVTVTRPDVLIGSGRSAAVEVIVTPEDDWGPGMRDLGGALQVDSNGGTADVDLRLLISVRTEFSLTPDRLVLSLGGEGAIIVRNLGRGTLEGAVTTSADWLQVRPRQVTVRPGRRARLEVTAMEKADSSEDGSALVTVASAGTTETVEVSITP